MKTKRTLLTLMLALLLAAANVQASTVVDEIKRIDDIACYHIPHFLLKNFTGMKDIITDVIPGTDVTALNDVESLDIIMVHKKSAKKKTRKLLENLAKDPSYQVIFQAKSKKQKDTVVYGLPLTRDDYKELIIVVDEDDNITIIDIFGTLNVDRLEKAVPIE